MLARLRYVVLLEVAEPHAAQRLEVAGLETQHDRPLVRGLRPVALLEIQQREQCVRFHVARVRVESTQRQPQRMIAPTDAPVCPRKGQECE